MTNPTPPTGADNWKKEYYKIWVEILNKDSNHVYYYELKGIIKNIEHFVAHHKLLWEEAARKKTLEEVKDQAEDCKRKSVSDGKSMWKSFIGYLAALEEK